MSSAAFLAHDTRSDSGRHDGVTLTATEAGLAQSMGSAIQASIETIRRRVDAFGTTEPSIQREGRNRVLVQVPGISDVERLKKLIGETGKLEFKMVDPAADALQAAETQAGPARRRASLLHRHAASALCAEGSNLVSGENLVDSQPASISARASQSSPSASMRRARSVSPA